MKDELNTIFSKRVRIDSNINTLLGVDVTSCLKLNITYSCALDGDSGITLHLGNLSSDQLDEVIQMFINARNYLINSGR